LDRAEKARGRAPSPRALKKKKRSDLLKFPWGKKANTVKGGLYRGCFVKNDVGSRDEELKKKTKTVPQPETALVDHEGGSAKGEDASSKE